MIPTFSSRLRRFALVVPAVVIALLFVVLNAGPQRLSPDGEIYAEMALTRSGQSPDAARVNAARARCASMAATEQVQLAFRWQMTNLRNTVEFGSARVPVTQIPDRERPGASTEWLDDCATTLVLRPISRDAQYLGIFEARPLFPTLASWLLPAMPAESALVVVSLIASAFALMLTCAAARVAGLTRAAALAAEGLAAVLPVGQEGVRPLTEGLTWFCLSILLYGFARTVTSRDGGQLRAGLLIQGVGIIMMLATRSASLMLLGGGLLLVICGYWFVHRRDLPTARVAVWLAGPVAAALAAVTIPAALGWPGASTSIADTITGHFRLPTPLDLMAQFLPRVFGYIGAILSSGAALLVLLTVLAVAVVATIRSRRLAVAALIWGPIVLGTLAALALPAPGEGPRLSSPATLGVAVALASLLVPRGHLIDDADAPLADSLPQRVRHDEEDPVAARRRRDTVSSRRGVPRRQRTP